MNISAILSSILFLALVSEPAICKKSDALVRSRLAQMSFGPVGAIQNGTERTLSTRTTSDLNSFVISSIQSSATLSQADRQTLLSEYFNLLKRNGAMGELLKDLFGVSPAPVPPTPKCEQTITLGAQYLEFGSDGYPADYPSDKPIDCIYYFTSPGSSMTSFSFQFLYDIDIDSNKASLKIFDGATIDSPLLLDVKTAKASSIQTKQTSKPVATVQFKSEVGAVGKWKFKL